MDTTQRVRLIAGVLLSPLLVPLLVYLTFLVFFGLDNYNSEATLESIRTIFWLNYIMTIVLGVPAFLFLRAKGFESLRNYTLLGTLFGFILILTTSPPQRFYRGLPLRTSFSLIISGGSGRR